MMQLTHEYEKPPQWLTDKERLGGGVWRDFTTKLQNTSSRHTTPCWFHSRFCMLQEKDVAQW